MTMQEVETERTVTETEELHICDSCDTEVDPDRMVVFTNHKVGVNTKNIPKNIHFHPKCAASADLIVPSEPPSFRDATDTSDRNEPSDGMTLTMNWKQQFNWFIGFIFMAFGLYVTLVQVAIGSSIVTPYLVFLFGGILIMFWMYKRGRDQAKQSISEFTWDDYVRP